MGRKTDHVLIKWSTNWVLVLEDLDCVDQWIGTMTLDQKL